MPIPLLITFRDMAHSTALETRILEKVAKLETVCADLANCEVTIEIPHRHKHQGHGFNVRIDAKLPGREVVADASHDDDVYIAVRDAFNAARRQLEEIMRIRRGQVKKHETSKQTPKEEP